MVNKQSTIFTGRNRGSRARSRGGGRGASVAQRDRSQSAATPVPQKRLIVKLKLDYAALTEGLRYNLLFLHPSVNDVGDDTQAIKEYEEEPRPEGEEEQPVDDEDLPVQPFVSGHLADPFVDQNEPLGQTTRAGRQVKAPKYHDTIPLDSDMIEPPSSVGKVDDEDDDEGEYREKSPPPFVVSRQQQHRPKPGRPRKAANAPVTTPPPPTSIDRQHSSSTVAPSSPPRPAAVLVVDSRTYEILNHLIAQPFPATSLPELTTPDNLNVEEPYSAKFLTELYMIAYAAGHWNTCDLVADTWIRMFHRLRRRSEQKDAPKESQIWRVNRALLKRRKLGNAGFDENPPTYGEKLTIDDPQLHEDAHAFDRDLLSRLYTHTSTNCGARLLWADSMALSGTKVEQQFQRAKKHNEPWHPDLVHDVTCTTLRLVRRKLTLKIEEGTEGAWCKRYHEHARRGLKCYREVAAWEVDGGEEVVGMKAKKRGRQGGTERGGGGPKRARVDREIVDIDAEGESE